MAYIDSVENHKHGDAGHGFVDKRQIDGARACFVETPKYRVSIYGYEQKEERRQDIGHAGPEKSIGESRKREKDFHKNKRKTEKSAGDNHEEKRLLRKTKI